MKLEEAIQEIKRRTDLAQVIGQTVKLRKNGSHYVGLCPFHGEKSPSFNVRPDRGYFKCFGCGASGDVFEFLQKTTGQLFIDIVKRLASEHGIEIEQTYKPRVNPAVADSLASMQSMFRQQLKGEALSYLTRQRKYSTDFIDKMELGYGGAVSGLFQGRITIPIKNHRGQLVAFGGRIFNDSEKSRPKYVNSAASELYDKGHVLYGLFESLPLIKTQKRVVLVEGYFDVMALLAVGIPAVAPCGTSLTEGHLELIHKYTDQVVLCFDQDSAGHLAHEKALLMFLSKGFSVQTVVLPAKDPDTLWQNGQAQTLKDLFAKPKDAIENRIELALQESVGGVHQRIGALQALMPVLSASPDPLVNRQYVRLAAHMLKEDEGLLVGAVLKYRPGSVKRAPARATAAPATRTPWSDAEKLLYKAVIAAPALVLNHPDILEDVGLNPELKAVLTALVQGENLLDITLPEVQLGEILVSGEEAEKIFLGWSDKVAREKRQIWLKEQHLKLMSATNQGNLDEVRQTLKDQSGALKKGWT
ncbi:MAG: CHC2 zinc finger domain-containing protein [Myxococcota bacterium]